MTNTESYPPEEKQQFIQAAINRLTKLEIALIAISIIYVALLAVSAFTDPDYRTFFVEEIHTGEAGRAKFLWGNWEGEGGRWQSIMSTPLSSLVSWTAFSILGFGLPQLRLAYIFFSAASLAFFFLALRRDLPARSAYAPAAAAVFMFSPLLTALRSTSMNELLYPLLFSSVVYCASHVRAGASAANARWFFSIALIAGVSMLVKVDGFLLPLAAAITFLIEMFRRRASLRDLAGFFLGGATAIAFFLLAVFLLIGLNRYIDGVAMTREVLSASPYTVNSIGDALNNMFVKFPTNLNSFIPGGPFLLFWIIPIGILNHDRLSLGGRFSLVLVTLAWLWSAAIPLLYWKKMVIIAPAVIYLGGALLSLLKIGDLRGASASGARSILFLGICAAIGAIGVLSGFNGMWRVVEGWEKTPFLFFAVISGIIFASIFMAWKTPQMKTAAVTISAFIFVAVIAQGLAQFTPKSFHRHTFTIGNSLGQILDGHTVVADHNGFRYAGYHTNARFRFVHENDPIFPNGVIQTAIDLQPDYVIVTDTYKPLSKLVEARLPDYRKIAQFENTHPLKGFGREPSTDIITVFSRQQLASVEMSTEQ